MKDLGAVLLCLLGGLFLFGAWRIFIERYVLMPDPEPESQLRSEREFQAGPSWLGALLVAAAFLLNPLVPLLEVLGGRERDKGWTPGWFAQCLFFLFSGGVFLAAGVYVGFT